jgi:hypothetical protein
VDTKVLRKQYMSLLPALNKTLGQVQEKLSDLPPSDFAVETCLKPYASIKRKMLTDRARHPSELSDLARGRLFFSEQFLSKEVLDILGQLFAGQVQQIQKKPDDVHGLEHHGIIDVHLNLDDMPFELQVLPLEYQPFIDMLHQIADKFHNPKERDKLDEHQQELLKKTHNKIHKGLHQKASDIRGL